MALSRLFSFTQGVRREPKQIILIILSYVYLCRWRFLLCSAFTSPPSVGAARLRGIWPALSGARPLVGSAPSSPHPTTRPHRLPDVPKSPQDETGRGGPRTPPRRPQDDLKTPPDAPTTATRPPPDSFKTAPRSTRIPPTCSQDALKTPLQHPSSVAEALPSKPRRALRHPIFVEESLSSKPRDEFQHPNVVEEALPKMRARLS